MPQVPLGLEAYSRTNGIVPEVTLKNFYLEKDSSGAGLDGMLRIQRPGLRLLIQFDAPIRGIYQMDGVMSDQTFVVAGDKLYLTDWLDKTEIGSVPDDGMPVAMAANALRLGLISAGEFLIYDGETLEAIELPDGRAPIDLDVLNGYFILPLSDGRFYWLAPDEPDFSSAQAVLAYATAESIPDGLHGARRVRDEFFLFGTRNIEVWQATGLSTSTFERAQGRTIDRGCHNRQCLATLDNTVFFVGDDGIVYRIADVPNRISTHGIEDRISRRTDDCCAVILTTQGHKFYVLTIPGEGTYAYDIATQGWSEFDWPVVVTCPTGTGVLAGTATGALAVFDIAATNDLGEPIERAVSGTIAVPPQRIANPHLALWIGASEDTTVKLRWKDGRDTDWRGERELAVRAGADIVDAWRLGATTGAFRTFEISTSSPAFIRISGALANEGRAL